MESRVEIRSAIDSAGALFKLSIASMIASGGLLFVTLFWGCGVRSFAQSDVFSLAVVPYVIAFLNSLGAMFYAMLRKNAAMEDEEKLELARRRDSSILEVSEDVRFGANRAFENYTRFAPYVITALDALAIGLMLVFFYRFWNVGRPEALLSLGTTKVGGSPQSIAILAAVMMAVSFFTGAFISGQARSAAYRWLRAAGSYFMVSFAVMLLAMGGALLKNSEKFYNLDPILAKIVFVLFILLMLELAASFVVEFYRPRTYELTRPIFESKILGIFTEPGGVMRNIADALDYQFGFKVSGTWLYAFIEQAIFPVLVLWLIALWGFTTVHMVSPGEVGVRLVFGKVVSRELLEPGMYFTLPWPFGTIDRYSCTKVEEIIIGEVEHEEEHDHEEEEDEHGHSHGPKPPKASKMHYQKLIVWTAAHSHEDSYFLVASAAKNSAASEQKKGVPTVDMVGLSMPIQYVIRRDGVFQYAYDHVDAQKILQRIAEQETTRYLPNYTLNGVISVSRQAIQSELKQRIQKAADREKLGIEIISVTLLDAHPPTTKGVAEAFHGVRVADEKAMCDVINAGIYKTTNNPEPEANRIEQDAVAYSYTRTHVAKAESERFSSQLRAYRTMPAIFKLKAYLDFLEKDCKDLRKFVVSKSMKGNIYELNFETSARIDLLDSNLDALADQPAEKKK